jgi:hypothetical protein
MIGSANDADLRRPPDDGTTGPRDWLRRSSELEVRSLGILFVELLASMLDQNGLMSGIG